MRLLEIDEPRAGGYSLEDGERGVLLGRSGAGKTQVLKQALGLTGSVLSRRGSPLAATCAYVPQTDGGFLDLTALENLTEPDRHLPALPASRARDWLDLVGMGEFVDVATHELPISQRRRVSLARALSRERPVLIIDGELDPILSTLLPTLLDTVPHLCSILTTSCVADTYTWGADLVGLVDERRVIARGTMAALAESLDPDVRSALAWTMP